MSRWSSWMMLSAFVAAAFCGCGVPVRHSPVSARYPKPLSLHKVGVMDFDDHATQGRRDMKLGRGYHLNDNIAGALSWATTDELRNSGMFASVVHIAVPSSSLTSDWDAIRWQYSLKAVMAGSVDAFSVDAERYEAALTYSARVVDMMTRDPLWSVSRREIKCRLSEAEAQSFGTRDTLALLMEKLVRAYLDEIQTSLAAKLSGAPSERPLPDVAAPPAKPPKPAVPQKVGQKLAVVVGISNYKYAGKGGLTSIRYAERDAKSFAAFLRSPEGGRFDHVLELVNEEATYPKIREALWEFLGRAIEEDLVLFYFSGHGSPDPKNRKNLYLVTHETDPEKMSSTAFPMWEIASAIERQIKAQRVVVITDACHGGGVSGDIGLKGIGGVRSNPVQDALLALGGYEGKLSLAACEAREESQESEKWGGGHGVFTHFLLKGLRGEADGKSGGPADGVVTIGEAIDYVSENVRRETNSQQHPIVAGPFDRAMPFVTVKK